MAGVSKKTPLPHWQRIMNDAGWVNAQEMARACGLPYSAVHQTIHGVNTPSIKTVLKIAKASGKKPDEICADIYRYLLDTGATTGGITR